MQSALRAARWVRTPLMTSSDSMHVMTRNVPPHTQQRQWFDADVVDSLEPLHPGNRPFPV